MVKVVKKDWVIQFYNKYETQLNIAFFLGGVIFDIITIGEIDSIYSIIQQAVYILVIGVFLYFDILDRYKLLNVKGRMERIWIYRDLITQFLMGGLLSVYSIFFIKSASLIASAGFILFMLAILVANELKFVQQSRINLKMALYFICVFSFFSMIIPVLMGFVGWVPFALALLATCICLWLFFRLVKKKLQSAKALSAGLVMPAGGVMLLFVVFYYLGWIPPVPLSVKEIGIYHKIEKTDHGDYVLYHENPWWKFWEKADEDFLAQAGDAVYVFVRVFSPTHFSDSVILHWQLYNEKRGWLTTDKIPMQISGGRKQGYRGYSYKENYQDGDYRVLVETLDGREIGRQSFNITSDSSGSERYFNEEVR